MKNANNAKRFINKNLNIPTIHGLQGLLLFRHGANIDNAATIAKNQFDLAIALAQIADHGSTLQLIGALWAVVAACCFEDARQYATEARQLLQKARFLTGAAAAIEILESIIETPDVERIEKALSALPFNYR